MSALASPERWQQVKLALGEVLERDAAQREAFLGELRSSDPELARDVQSLLGWYDASEDLLSLPSTSANAAGTLAAGDRLGPYEVLEVVGRGGMGAVYRARDVRLGRVVAVKVVAGATDGGAALLRFEREARTVASLSHPGILAIFDYGREGEIAYAVTELLQGESLRSRLRRGPMPLAEALGLARQVASGLSAAHEKGIVHRDLKPENVFLCADGTAKILDFGLAKPPAPLAGAGSSLTRVGVLMGTVGYMAPEQVRGENVDARADVFAFGVMLHEILVGERPFDRATPAETLAAVLRDEPRPSIAAATPPPLARLLDRCLAKDPAHRFGSAHELLQAIESTNALHWTHRSRLTRRAAIAAGLSMLLASAASVARQRSTAPRPADLMIAVGLNPMSLAFDGANVWVGNRGSNTVTRISVQDGRTTGTFSVGESPAALAWDGASVWVACHKWLSGGYSTLMKLDPVDGRTLATHRLPGQPVQLVVDRDVLWVTETWPTYALRKLRIPDAAELGAFSAGGTPRQVVTDGESVWASNGGLGSVSKIRASDGRILLSRELGGAPMYLERVGSELWTHNQKGTLFKLRAEDLAIVDRMKLEEPRGYAVTNRWLFMSDRGRIVQRRRSDGTVLAAWASGPNPNLLMFDGTNLWATDWDANSVTLIRGESLAAADPL